MKPTRHYPKRHYKPNLRILAAYMQPLKVNTEPTKTIAGETIVCEPIAKRMNALGKVSRGLDRTNPEYNRKSRAKLGQLLQQAIGQVYQLERDHEQKLMVIDGMRDAAFSLFDIYNHHQDTQQPIDPEQIYLLAVDMLEQLEPAQEVQP